MALITISGIVPILVLAAAAYWLVDAAYNVFCHPLRAFPGPKLWAMSRLPFIRKFITGNSHKNILDLHNRYGPIVRIAPDELSCSYADAWNDIMGHHGTQSLENQKDDAMYPMILSESIISANPINHARMRRVLAPKFSNTALQSQEDAIQHHVDLLISRFHDNFRNGNTPQDVVYPINCTTVDVVSDVIFGKSFYCIRSPNVDPFVTKIFDGVKVGAMLGCLRRFSFFHALLDNLIPSRFQDDPRMLRLPWTADQLSTLMTAGGTRSDTAGLREEDYLTKKEALGNALLLLIAGSETSATALSAAIYHLSMNKPQLDALTQEICSAFKTESEITISKLQKMPYVAAVIDEAMRLYPPLAAAMPRRVAKGGCNLLGQYVPENTIISIWHWPLFRRPEYYPSPNSFIPERWLNTPKAGDDSTKAFKPFHYGPRDCIGKNLAYMEMRLIIARIIWNFELEIAEESKSWVEKSRAYNLWEKGRLMVHLIPRKGRQ